MPLQTPVLLIGFNRPDDMADLVNHLRPHAPTRLYIAVDGPRSGVQGEAERVARTQSTKALVDWDCKVQTLFPTAEPLTVIENAGHFVQEDQGELIGRLITDWLEKQ